MDIVHSIVLDRIIGDGHYDLLGKNTGFEKMNGFAGAFEALASQATGFAGGV